MDREAYKQLLTDKMRDRLRTGMTYDQVMRNALDVFFDVAADVLAEIATKAEDDARQT